MKHFWVLFGRLTCFCVHMCVCFDRCKGDMKSFWICNDIVRNFSGLHSTRYLTSLIQITIMLAQVRIWFAHRLHEESYLVGANMHLTGCWETSSTSAQACTWLAYTRKEDFNRTPCWRTTFRERNGWFFYSSNISCECKGHASETFEHELSRSARAYIWPAYTMQGEIHSFPRGYAHKDGRVWCEISKNGSRPEAGSWRVGPKVWIIAREYLQCKGSRFVIWSGKKGWEVRAHLRRLTDRSDDSYKSSWAAHILVNLLSSPAGLLHGGSYEAWSGKVGQWWHKHTNLLLHFWITADMRHARDCHCSECTFVLELLQLWDMLRGILSKVRIRTDVCRVWK